MGGGQVEQPATPAAREEAPADYANRADCAQANSSPAGCHRIPGHRSVAGEQRKSAGQQENHAADKSRPARDGQGRARSPNAPHLPARTPPSRTGPAPPPFRTRLGRVLTRLNAPGFVGRLGEPSLPRDRTLRVWTKLYGKRTIKMLCPSAIRLEMRGGNHLKSAPSHF